MNGTDSTAGTATRRHSVPQAARQLGISERAVRKRIAAGSLTATRDGRRWLVELPAVPEGRSGGTAAPEAVPEAVPPSTVAALMAEVEYLRAALERSQTAEAEQRRIIAGLVARLPQLPEASTATPAEPTEAPATDQQRRSWWRWLIGG